LAQKAREFVEKGNELYVPYRQELAVYRKSWNALQESYKSQFDLRMGDL